MQNFIDNLKYKFMQNSKLKYYVVMGGIFLLIIIGLIVYLCLPKQDKIEPEIEDLPIEDIVEEELEVEEKEVSQDETVNLLRAFITDKRNLSYKYIYEILVGSGESKTNSLVTADKNTVFFDLNDKIVINPEGVNIGETIILYAKGKYTASNLTAAVICKGSDTSYRYAILDKYEGTMSNCKLTLLDSGDTLLINSNTNIINGLSGGTITGLPELSSNDRLLYKYLPEFEITEKGNVYTCSEIIVLGGVG